MALLSLLFFKSDLVLKAYLLIEGGSSMSYIKRYLEDIVEDLSEREDLNEVDAMTKVLEVANDDGYSFEEEEEDD